LTRRLLVPGGYPFRRALVEDSTEARGRAGGPHQDRQAGAGGAVDNLTI
jgi:hypothetical protein